MKSGMAQHERTKGFTDEWLTPPRILNACGGPLSFELDPCSPINRPWMTALKHLTVKDNGLAHEWLGRVWMNPPYGHDIVKWMRRMALHRNGIALVFARTDTEWFQEYVFREASAILFLAGRLKFCFVDGSESENSAGAPSALISYDTGDKNNRLSLFEASRKLDGRLVHLDNP